MRYRVAVEELSGKTLLGYKDRLAKTATEMETSLEIFSTGGIFSLGERRIDNREYFIVLSETFEDKTAAEARQERLRNEYPGRQILVIPVFIRPAEATLTVTAHHRTLLCKDFVSLSVTVTAQAPHMALVAGRPLFLYATSEESVGIVIEEDVEQLLYRILPGEMFVSAPIETLKAQAVAARTDIFMQLGKRHIGDPFHICSEIHCQKLDWREKETAPKFKQAVDTTRGEILLYKDIYVVRAPYSSSCGGHTEAIENVWFSSPREYLRGVWDMPNPPRLDLTRAMDVRKFLEETEGECDIPLNKKFRWKKEIPEKNLDELVAALGVGHVTELRPVNRGVSGRIWKLLVIGDTGEKAVWGELIIRRLLDDMPSSLFVVDHIPEKKVWRFTGAGWGHGVGMCQMGAISLGKRGKKYREILDHYYPGTMVSKIY